MSASPGYDPYPCRKILYVEDDRHLCRLMHLSLRRHGYEVEVAENGAEALAVVGQQRFDALLIDYTLPDTSGLELARDLQPQAEGLPMIMLTGAGDERLAVRALKQGFRDYIVKDPHGLYFRDLPYLIQQAIDKVSHERVREEAEGARNRLIKDLNAFAQNVAHDLKGPLSGMTGLLNMLEEPDLRMPAHRDLIGSLHGQVTKMKVIIDELLLMARLKEGEIAVEPVDMTSLVGEVLRRFEHDIRRTQAQIDVCPLPQALGRGPWLEEVWANLISNALKYGGPKPHIEIGGTCEPGQQVRFWVQDRGPGLPPTAYKRVFRPQVRLSSTRHLEGEGLGLSIVKRIIEKLGGKVGAENRHGGGACFYFTLADALETPTVHNQVAQSRQKPRVWA